MKKQTIANLVMVAIIVVIVAAGVLSVGHIRGWFDHVDEQTALLTEVRGTVNLERDGIIYPVENDTVLRAGDRIRCNPGATATVEIGGGYLAAGQSAELEITDPAAGHFAAEVTAGEMFVSVPGEVTLAFDGKNIIFKETTALLSVRSGAQSIGVFSGAVEGAGAGQQLDWVGDELAIAELSIKSLNDFAISQIRNANKTQALCFTDDDLDQLKKERQEALQANLRPFLKRYDTTNSRRAGEIVSSVSDSFVTYRALCEEYKKKDHALRAFIAEKELDKPLPDEEVPAHDELIAAERALQKRQNDTRELHARLGAELERLSIELDRIPEAEAELRSAEERLATYNANLKVVTATQNMLAEAKEALSTRYLGGMQESFLHYLSELTEGEVPEAVIDSSFAVRTRAMGQSREMESFSRGNQDAVRFCVRLSLTEELHRDGEKPFLLLDDPFVNLDEEHLRATHKLLERLSQRYQIIHMICHEGRR